MTRPLLAPARSVLAMADGLRIGELAERTGRSAHTIRWYEKQGLIPGVLRDGAGRRAYTEQHVGWLELMERLRRTGMSIAEMRHYTELVKQGRATLAQRQALLAAHRLRVLEAIAEWRRALTLLEGKIDFYGEWLNTGKRPALTPLDLSGAAPRSRRTRRRP